MSSAWSKQKRRAFESAFYDFLDNCYINSKDLGGHTCLGENLYDAQTRLNTEIFDGFEQDIHSFYVLKSRQLGVSTDSRALGTFWLGIHEGLQGSTVFDTDTNKKNARREIESMIDNLPRSIKFPRIRSRNRDMLTLENESTLMFMSAGIKASKSSGTLGRSAGLSFAHCCMAPGTPVLIGDGRSVPIERVKVGDRVITHTGQTACVLANVGQPNTKGPMLRITSWLGEPITCTADHKIATARGLVPAGEIRKDDRLVMPVRTISCERTLDALPATLSRPQGGGAVAAASGKEVALDEEMGFVVGYYLAEGSITYQRRGDRYYEFPSGIVFSRHQSERGYADRVAKTIAPYTTGKRTTEAVSGTLTEQDHFYGSSFARWLSGCYGAQDGKFIPDAVFTYGQSFCRGLLLGLLSGDGSKTINVTGGYSINRVNLTSTRSSIAYQARDLAASLGYGWAMVAHRPAGRFYGRNCKERWTVTWTGAAAASLRRDMGLPVVPSSDRYRQKYVMNDHSVFLKIRKIENGIDVPEMFDISVDHQDHTFRTAHFSVSNSEMCSWDSEEGVEAFINSLSEVNPNRFYLWESTARGYEGIWNDMWNTALEDEAHSKCIFLGWYLKPSQSIKKTDPDFAKYGESPPTDRELEIVETVKKLYDWEITDEQLAWYRRKMDPTATADGDAPAEYVGNTLRIQEQPNTADEAWQMTGTTFFDAEALTDQAHKNCSSKFKSYVYLTGMEFAETRVYPARNQREVQLKVWEEPQEDSVYVICDDVAFGHDEHNDRSAISVLRCYADGMDQVAEYAYPLVNTRQFAWVIASLMGWYGGESSTVYHIMEINGPGEAAWNELQSLKFQIANSYTPKEIEEKGLRNVFKNVRNYMFTRSDSMTPGQAWQWKTTTQLKVAIMERLRDFTVNGMLRIRSLDTLEEMRRVSREGDSICAQGSAKDDRVMALAMGVKMWEDRARKELIVRHRTRDFEMNKRRMTLADQVQMFNKNQLTSFFAVKKIERGRARAAELRAKWRR